MTKQKTQFFFQSVKPTHKLSFFWQPKKDYLCLILSKEYGNMLMVLLNYVIWFFLLFISYLIISKSPNAFWQILIAIIIGEYIEKLGKHRGLWYRPLYLKNRNAPPGLVERWYNTGSFPSGHTIKAVFFFLFILQYQVFNPMVYAIITIPLLVFRVLVGFHYPLDMLGGILFGTLIWFLTKGLIFPDIMVNAIQMIVNFIFLK